VSRRKRGWRRLHYLAALLDIQLSFRASFPERSLFQAQSTRPCSPRWVCFGVEVRARASAAPFRQTAQGLEQSPLAAPILGPLVGGFITTYASWRWMFLLSVPLGLLGVVLAHWLIPNSRSSQKSPFDWIGFILTSAACVSLMYGLDLIGRQEINRLTTGLLLVCSLAIGVSVVRSGNDSLYQMVRLRWESTAVTFARRTSRDGLK
jgi:MFS family permease